MKNHSAQQSILKKLTAATAISGKPTAATAVSMKSTESAATFLKANSNRVHFLSRPLTQALLFTAFLATFSFTNVTLAAQSSSQKALAKSKSSLRIRSAASADATHHVIENFLITTRQAPKSYASTEATRIMTSAKATGLDPIAFAVHLRFKSYESKTLGRGIHSYPVTNAMYKDLSRVFPRTSLVQIQSNTDLSIWALANHLKMKLSKTPENGAFVSSNYANTVKLSANISEIPSARWNLAKSGVTVQDVQQLLTEASPYLAGAENRMASWAKKWIVTMHVEAVTLSR